MYFITELAIFVKCYLNYVAQVPLYSYTNVILLNKLSYSIKVECVWVCVYSFIHTQHQDLKSKQSKRCKNNFYKIVTQ